MNLKEVREKYPGAYDDMSDEQLAKALHSKFYADMPYDDFAQKVGLSKPQPKSRLDALLDQTKAVGREAGQFAVGAGKGLMGAVDFVEGKPRNKDAFKRIEEIIGSGPATSVGEAFSPTNLMLGPLLRGAGVAKQALGGAGVGAIAGQTQLDKESDLATDALIGGGIGAAFGTLGHAGKAAKDIYNTFAPGKPTHLAKQLYEDSVGKQNMPALLKELDKQLAAGSVTPYKKTTTEMLAHMPDSMPLIALQKQIAKGDGGTSARYYERWADQKGAIETIESLLPKSKRRMTAAQREMFDELQGIKAGREAVKNPLQPTKVRTVEQVAAEAAPAKFVPQMLYSPFTLSRWVLNKFGKNQETIAHEIEDVMRVYDLDPKAFQEAFKHMSPEQAAKVNRALTDAKLGLIGLSTQD